MEQVDASKGHLLLAAILSWWFQILKTSVSFWLFFSSYQLSQKGSLPVDGQAATPASVSSAEASSLQVPSDVTATLEPKVEHDDEEEEVDEEESMTGGRTGKKGDIKVEEKPEVKQKKKSCEQ